MRHATITDTDGDRLLIHGTPEALFVTVREEDGTRTAGGFTRAQLRELLDAVAPPGPCGRSCCWKEDGHDGPCAPSGRPHPDVENPLIIERLRSRLREEREAGAASESEAWARAAKAEEERDQAIADRDTAENERDAARGYAAELEAAARLRGLLTAYGDQDADADDYEGRLSVFLARHGARVDGGDQ